MRINEMKEKKIFSDFYSMKRKSSRFCLMNDSRMRFFNLYAQLFSSFSTGVSITQHRAILHAVIFGTIGVFVLYYFGFFYCVSDGKVIALSSKIEANITTTFPIIDSLSVSP
jgi:hypothetical protein